MTQIDGKVKELEEVGKEGETEGAEAGGEELGAIGTRRAQAAPPCLSPLRGLGGTGGPHWGDPLLPLSSGLSPVLRTQGQDGLSGKGPIRLPAQVQASPPALLSFCFPCSVLFCLPPSFPHLLSLPLWRHHTMQERLLGLKDSNPSLPLSVCVTPAKSLTLPKTPPQPAVEVTTPSSQSRCEAQHACTHGSLHKNVSLSFLPSSPLCLFFFYSLPFLVFLSPSFLSLFP